MFVEPRVQYNHLHSIIDLAHFANVQQWHEHETKKKFPNGNRTHGLSDTGWETRGELSHLLGWYVTRVLRIARNSNVEIIKCV